jgi:hypothetical protein
MRYISTRAGVTFKVNQILADKAEELLPTSIANDLEVIDNGDKLIYRRAKIYTR